MKNRQSFLNKNFSVSFVSDMEWKTLELKTKTFLLFNLEDDNVQSLNAIYELTYPI